MMEIQFNVISFLFNVMYFILSYFNLPEEDPSAGLYVLSADGACYNLFSTGLAAAYVTTRHSDVEGGVNGTPGSGNPTGKMTYHWQIKVLS